MSVDITAITGDDRQEHFSQYGIRISIALERPLRASGGAGGIGRKCNCNLAQAIKQGVNPPDFDIVLSDVSNTMTFTREGIR